MPHPIHAPRVNNNDDTVMVVRIAVVARNTEPENVDGNAILVNFESGGLSG